MENFVLVLNGRSDLKNKNKKINNYMLFMMVFFVEEFVFFLDEGILNKILYIEFELEVWEFVVKGREKK